MNPNAIAAYRLNRVQSATPVGLVVLLHEAAISSLHRAIHALQQNDTEKRVSELNRVLAVIAQLQGTLDYERGGDKIPPTLNKFYEVMRARILEASIKKSEPILQTLVEQFGAMREAWQQVDAEVHGMGRLTPAQVPAAPAILEYR